MVVPENVAVRDPSRRQFLALGIGALVVASVPVAMRRRRVVRQTVPVMGTIAEFAVVHPDPVYAYAAIGAARRRLDLVETMMTRYKATSDVGRANGAGGREAVHVTTETATVLDEALRWAERSEGAFDPCLGTAIELWDVGHRHVPPPADAVRRLAGGRFYRDLDVDRWRGHPAARLSAPEARIDLGGIAKGYGVDQAVQELRDWGIRDAIVNVGGDLYAMGQSEDGNPWRIGVRSPASASEMLATLDVRDEAIATSGDYLRYFEYRGRRYHHLLDPATAAPRVSAMHSITVRADACMTADVAATACFGRDAASTAGWLQRAGARIVHSV
jgi:thiamine biosynthesis lipoprotein